MIFVRILVGLAIFASLTGCENWPEDGKADAQALLDRGPRGLDCYNSHWAKTSGYEQPKPSHLVGSSCRFKPERTLWFASDDAVLAVSRCDYGAYTYEFSVVTFSSAHHYDGYFCSKAAGPRDGKLPPLGELTDRGTAMDGEFEPFPTKPAD